ncbi:MAG: GNAT family N-acetyltransferase [Frankiaceae bacterium]
MPRPSTRPAISVRRAALIDLTALLDLLAELRSSSARSSRPLLRETLALGERLHELLSDDAASILLAESADGNAVGMAVLTSAPLTSLTDVPAVRMDYAMVSRRARRQGVGRALVAAAGTHAEIIGAEQLAVAVVPSDRESNRFYARLGFAPVLVRRTTSVPALMRKLASPERRAAVDDLTRRRLIRRPTARRSLPGAASSR